MGSLSIRGVDDELKALLKKEATAVQKSVNQLVLEILRKQTGLEKKNRFTQTHHDLDHLFGKWTEAEFGAIQTKIDGERQTDDELWK